MDRNTITVMSGQVVDVFDQDFRELYAISEQVDLYREFNITKPPIADHIKKSKVEPIKPTPVSRFQVSVNDTKQIDFKVPAHKYHNPKYSLVFGNSAGLSRSLQDLSSAKDSVVSTSTQRTAEQSSILNVSKDSKGDKPETQSSTANTADDEQDLKAHLKKTHNRKQLTFRSLLKGKHTHHAPPETIDEGVVSQHSPAQNGKVPHSPVQNGKVGTHLSPGQNGKVLLVDANGGNELEDGFEILEKPGTSKSKSKKTGKLVQRSVSLQAINVSAGEDGYKNRRKSPKKNCIQQ